MMVRVWIFTRHLVFYRKNKYNDHKPILIFVKNF